MSETITKACDSFECEEGRLVKENQHGLLFDAGPCPECKGAGRVPDVEATLRAEVAELRAKVYGRSADARDAAARARHATPGPLRVVSDVMYGGRLVLTTERGAFVGGGLSAVDAEFFANAQGDVLALTAELADRDATIAGLNTAVETLTRVNGDTSRALAERDDIHRGLMETNAAYYEGQLAERDAALAVARAEIERLTADVHPKNRPTGPQERHDDMWNGRLKVSREDDGGMYVSLVLPGRGFLDAEFRAPGPGGGKSPRTWRALQVLLDAMTADNEADGLAGCKS